MAKILPQELFEIQYAILFEMGRSRKPFGIWLYHNKDFDHYYAEGYFERSDYFHKNFDNFDFSKVNIDDFWEYWGEQGGFNWALVGPIREQVYDSIQVFGKEAVEDLEKFVERVNTKGLVAMPGKGV